MRAAGPAPYARRAAPAAALRQSRRLPDVRRARRCKARALSLQGEIAAAAAAERKPRADIVLSSGFLAFAYHCGFVEACMESVEISGIMGTSAGALTGSLLAAGYTPDEVEYELARVAPMEYLSPNPQLWQGVLKMDGVVRQLATLLPETFDELKTPFACAVVDADTGAYKIIREGNLPEAVTASAAVPVLFAPVSVAGVDGGPWQDGGKHDRVGLEGWQELRTGGLVGGHVDEGPIVHLIERSSPFSGADDVDMSARACGATVVRSPKSGQSLLALNKDTFKQQREIAAGRTHATLAARKGSFVTT